MEGTIHIEITGDADSGKTVIGNLINDTLEKHGFKNVTQINDTGEPVARIPDTPSVLDLVRESRPELFETPITISETTWGGDNEVLGGDSDLESAETEANALID